MPEERTIEPCTPTAQIQRNRPGHIMKHEDLGAFQKQEERWKREALAQKNFQICTTSSKHKPAVVVVDRHKRK